MNKPRTSLVIIGSFVFIVFIVFLAYAALLGENNKIDDVINKFFSSMKSYDYDAVCHDLSVTNKRDLFPDTEDCSEMCFLFELVLLKKYNLLNQENYKIKLKRNHFWIPYLRDEPVHVSILLTGQNAKSKIFSSAEREPDFIPDLIEVQRLKGSWIITGINFSDSSIAMELRDLKSRLHLDQYISESPEGIVLDTLKVDTNNVTPIDRRALLFILNKIENHITSLIEK